MKTLILAICCLLAANGANAQLGFGPEIGIGGSNMKFTPNSAFTSSSTSGIPSGRVGGIIDANFTKHVYFQSGLFLSYKGHKREYSFYVSDSLNEAISKEISLNYIDLPLGIVFKSRSQGKGRAFLGIGATMSYLVGGTATLHAQGKYNDTAFVRNNKATADKELRKFDIGATFFAGYELPTGLFFKLYYVSGVKDLGLFSEVTKNRMWGISAGYIFGKGRNVNKDPEGLIEK